VVETAGIILQLGKSQKTKAIDPRVGICPGHGNQKFFKEVGSRSRQNKIAKRGIVGRKKGLTGKKGGGVYAA